MSKTQIAYLLAGIAIGLRLASDWIFRQGGPFSYQLVQAFFLLLAIAFLAPQWHEVFLAKGRFRSALKIALWAAPIGLLMGIGDAILSYGRLYWPSWNQIILPIANNLFFPAVEELEFRGFALSWLFKKKIGKPLVIALIVTISSLAHAHRFWVIDLRAWFCHCTELILDLACSPYPMLVGRIYCPFPLEYLCWITFVWPWDKH